MESKFSPDPTYSQAVERLLLWAKELESGKYTQTMKALRIETDSGPTFCCLGVACDLFGDKRNWARRPDGQNRVAYKDYLILPPGKVYRTMGIHHLGLSFDLASLISMNDRGSSFREIAGEIRKMVRHAVQEKEND